MTRRTQIFLAGIALGAVCAPIPMLVSTYTAWRASVSAEYRGLDAIAANLIERANSILDRTKSALDSIEKSNLMPCSAAHISRMRALTVGTATAEEVGYFENNILKCTTWGEIDQTVQRSKPDFIGKYGVAVTLRVRPMVSAEDEMTAVHYGAYNVLIAPSRFIDIPIARDISVALTDERGQIVAASSGANTDFAQLVSGSDVNDVDGNRFYAVARRDGLVAIAMAPRARATEAFQSVLHITIPVSIVLAALIGSLVARWTKQRMSLLADLRRAIKNHEFLVMYQPIINLATENCIAAEALVRWGTSNLPSQSPDNFIPLAEKNHLISEISCQVVNAVFKDMGHFLKINPDFHISINLSSSDICSGSIIIMIHELVMKAEISPRQIWLEVTERSFMDVDVAQVTCARARDLGFVVAIDDFGTGYSSLQYLQNLEVDVLKIDKEFIRGIECDFSSNSVVDHVIKMAKSLGLLVVAEGVESEIQVKYLRDLGVDFAQGWFYAKALSADQFLQSWANFSSSREERQSPPR